MQKGQQRFPLHEMGISGTLKAFTFHSAAFYLINPPSNAAHKQSLRPIKEALMKYEHAP